MEPGGRVRDERNPGTNRTDRRPRAESQGRRAGKLRGKDQTGFGRPDAPHAEAASAGEVDSGSSRTHDRGGQGEVWIAEDTELHRKVALKQLRAHCADDPISQARFVHEAEVTGRLEHRGIVPVYSLGRFENGRPFYAMRFVAGTRLGDAIVKFHVARTADPAHVDCSLKLRRLLGRFVDVCNTVAYVHSRGVLHRDLKPANIILDEYGETLVVDWGLAKSGSRDLDPASTEITLPTVSVSKTPSTLAGTTIGTPAYMSPEQASGPTSELGPATDVYSLGATLYCVLTGKPPFEGRDPSIILPKVARRSFPGRVRSIPACPSRSRRSA